MKITLFIGSLYGGGAERVTCNLASYLVQHGHQVEILTMSETEKAYELDKRVSVRTLLSIKERKNTVRNTLVRMPRFWRYLKVSDTDAYIVMLPKTTIMLLMFRWLTKAKVIAAERVDPASYSERIAKMLKKYAKRADGWVFQTGDAQKWYGDSIKDSKSTVIPNAVNPAFIRPQYEGKKRKIIAGAGRLDVQKNFGLLIRAFAKIAPEFPEYNLIIYGKGNEEQELKSLVESLGLQGRIEFPGNIQNIAEEMERNTMFVLSSDFEGMPNALMEAMALGLPCISTDCPCGGPRYLIKDGVNGLLVPVADADKMAEAMRKILSDSNLAESIGKEAMKIAEELAPDKIYGQWERLVSSIVNGR